MCRNFKIQFKFLVFKFTYKIQLPVQFLPQGSQNPTSRLLDQLPRPLHINPYKSNIYVLYQRKVTQDLYFGYKLQEDAQDIKVLEELCVFERKCDDFEPLNTEFLYYYKEKQEAPKVFPLKFADQVVKEKLEQIISS
ncbi:Hypothetical_protein [Hexamita inflata]|nr:Hypothetical protein HINF_LOCUS34038 [Hexamita inflata]